MTVFYEYFWPAILVTLSGYIIGVVVSVLVTYSPNFRKRFFGKLTEVIEKEEK